MNNEILYKGKPSPISLVIKNRRTGNPLDFSGTTRMVMILEGSGVTIDTDIDNTLLDWSKGNGELVLNLGLLEIPTGPYSVWLFVYDQEHISGQAVITPNNNGFGLTVVEVPEN